MFTVIIKNSGEKSVIKLTYENLWKELKNIPGSQIIVEDDWFAGLERVKNKFVCLVEPDCLVNSGYFASLAGYLKKNPQLGHLGVLSTATAVNNWAVKFYGYSLGGSYVDGIIPNKDKKGTRVSFYTAQAAYIPGSIVRLEMLKDVLSDIGFAPSWTEDLVYMSTMISFGFWRRNWMVYIAPNSTYCSTEDYINDIGKFDPKADDLIEKFARETI